ncbi:MAG: DsbA family protein [Coriobacteriia bacterium]|nr:DsbA family protein [Coriobacteriia bacterium]
MAEEHSHEHTAFERPRVLVFFDYACPFCYVDQHRFNTLESELDVDFDIFLVPFELRPTMPDEGIELSQDETGHSERVDEYLERAAKKEGFPLSQPSLLPKTHKALVLGEVARDLGDALHRRVHAAIFRAYFGEGKDIGSSEVLLGIAGEFGIEREELEKAWEEGTHDERLHQFRHIALHLGLDATPAALICNELFIGSRPAGVLREALERCDSHLEAERDGVVGAAEGHPSMAGDADEDPAGHVTRAEAVES